MANYILRIESFCLRSVQIKIDLLLCHFLFHESLCDEYQKARAKRVREVMKRPPLLFYCMILTLKKKTSDLLSLTRLHVYAQVVPVE